MEGRSVDDEKSVNVSLKFAEGLSWKGVRSTMKWASNGEGSDDDEVDVLACMLDAG